MFYHFGVALAIGLLIGMERQYKAKDQSNGFLFGGIRTFPIMALIGCTSALIGDISGVQWISMIPIILVAIFLFLAYKASIKIGDYGMTTEVTALLTTLIGYLCYHGYLEIATALAVVILILLSLKTELHKISNKLTEVELISLAKFGLMTFIVLPILPDEAVFPAPFDVLIPKNIWLMVILVTAIGMVGYFLKKWIGNNKAIVLTGFLGGLISSTAVTLSFSSKSKESPNLASAFTIAIIVAWITMFIRVIIEVFVVNPSLVSKLWIPMFAAAMAGIIYCIFIRKKVDQSEEVSDEANEENPFSLKKSLAFGFLYALVIVIANIAQIYYGDSGIYISSIAAGFTDVDAITLSMAEMSKINGSVKPDVAVNAITLAAISNTLVKATVVLSTAHPKLKRSILPGVIMIVLSALLAIFFI